MTVDHIAAVVSDLKETVRKLEDGFGFKTLDMKSYGDMDVAFMDAGNVKLELIEPKAQSPYASFLGAGEGLNHIAVQVESIAESLDRLSRLGVKAADAAPRQGRSGIIVNLAKESTSRISIQLFQKTEA